MLMKAIPASKRLIWATSTTKPLLSSYTRGVSLKKSHAQLTTLAPYNSWAILWGYIAVPCSMSSGGCSVMYGVKPHYELRDKDVPLPQTMYKVTPCNGQVSTAQVVVNGEDIDIQALLEKQESVLARLTALKREMLSMCSEDSTQRQTKTISDLMDVVVNADPLRPPLSLLVLKNMLAEHYRVLCNVHAHSSSTGNAPLIMIPSDNSKDRHKYQLVLTLIWKGDLRAPSLTINQSHIPIEGEANIARYLARLLQPQYDACDVIRATEIDMLVDQAASLYTANSKEKAAALKSLNQRLGKSSFLLGDDVTLADIVTWSVLRTTGLNEGAPKSVVAWVTRLNQHKHFAPIDRLLR